MLRVLVSLSRTQSFSRTAEQLRITRPVVRHAVHGVDAVIGVPLILRERNSATPGRRVSDY
ncbi:helix-turn-helix domain-containing protein [Vineibacter terrae]